MVRAGFHQYYLHVQQFDRKILSYVEKPRGKFRYCMVDIFAHRVL